jgi:hypothetical protein
VPGGVSTVILRSAASMSPGCSEGLVQGGLRDDGVANVLRAGQSACGRPRHVDVGLRRRPVAAACGHQAGDHVPHDAVMGLFGPGCLSLLASRPRTQWLLRAQTGHRRRCRCGAAPHVARRDDDRRAGGGLVKRYEVAVSRVMRIGHQTRIVVAAGSIRAAPMMSCSDPVPSPPRLA